MSQYTWTPVLTDVTSFNNVAMSSTGQFMLVCSAGDTTGSADPGLFLSSDYGAHWNITSVPFQYAQSCNAITMSDDASYMFVFLEEIGDSANNLPSFVSTDYGMSWTNTFSDFTFYSFSDVAANSTAQQVVGCVSGGQDTGVFINRNWGAQGEWVNVQLDTTKKPVCNSIASSSSGQYLAAVNTYTTGGVYLSNDYGHSWFTSKVGNNNNPFNFWSTITMDSTGQELILAGTATTASVYYTSSNFGSAWVSEPTAQMGVYYQSVALSRDGAIAGTSATNGIYTSDNAGATWTAAYPPPSDSTVVCVDSSYRLVAVSSDGSIMLASLCSDVYVGTSIDGGGGGSGGGGLSGGAVAGVVIGVLAGVSLIAAGVWFFILPMFAKAPLASAAGSEIAAKV